MGISGIDAQIMVARTTEYAKDNTIQQKRPEVIQQQLAGHVKQIDEREQQSVVKSIEGEMVRMHPDDGNKENNEYEQKHGKGKEKKEEETVAPGTVVPPSINIIDIKI